MRGRFVAFGTLALLAAGAGSGIEAQESSFEWQSAMVFEIGVVMVVGGGLSAAALWLWGGAGPAAGEE